jgi:hypothetical protein
MSLVGKEEKLLQHMICDEEGRGRSCMWAKKKITRLPHDMKKEQ